MLVAFVLMCNAAFGWGKTGHQIINGSFEKFLPSSMEFLSSKSSYYVAHASDADNRKGADPDESQKHYIDIDYYPEFSIGTLTHNYDSLCAEYGKATVVNKGTLPWTINSTYDALVVYLRNHDWAMADSVIADLGHYIGDAFQPLHCTLNYDGAMTGNGGIHSLFESKLLEEYRGDIEVAAGIAPKLDTTPLEFAFRVIGKSNSDVPAILAADTYAGRIDPSYGSAYYSAMWSKLDTMMNERLQGASEALATLVYSAWLDAGEPVPTGIARTAVPSGFSVSDVYPNPFNPTAKIDVALPSASKPAIATFSVFSAEGRLVRQEDRLLVPGQNPVSLDFTPYASGVYFILVRFRDSENRRGAALKAILLK